jgi:O-antigen/teichoic acid export membrane protein
LDFGKTAAKALTWTALESFTLSGLSLLTLLVFARLITAEEFGVFAIALAIVQTLTSTVDLLFHDALIQRPDLQPIDIDSAHGFSVLLGGTFAAACWLLADHVAVWVGNPHVALPLRSLSIMPLGAGFGAVLVATQRRNLAFRALAVRSVVARALAAVSGVALALLDGGIWSLVLQQVLLVCLSTLVLWWLAEQRPKLRLRWGPTRELLRFGLLATSGQLVAMFIPRTFMVMVGTYLGSESAGLLNLAFRGVDMLRDLLAAAVGHVAMPLLSRMRDKPEDLYRSFNRAVELTVLVTFPLFVGLALCAEEVILIAFGETWRQATPYFSVVAMMCLATFTRMYAPALLQTLGHPGAPVIDLLVQELWVVLGMLFVGKLSTTHAIVVWASSLIAAVPLDMWIQRYFTKMSFRRQLRGLEVPSFAVGLMAIAVLLLRSALPSDWPAALRIVPMIALGAIVYCAVVAALAPTTVKALWGFASHAVKKDQSAGVSATPNEPGS